MNKLQGNKTYLSLNSEPSMVEPKNITQDKSLARVKENSNHNSDDTLDM